MLQRPFVIRACLTILVLLTVFWVLYKIHTEGSLSQSFPTILGLTFHMMSSSASTVNSTLSPSIMPTNGTHVHSVDPDKAMRDFYIGFFLAVSSSIFIGASFILKKKGLKKLATSGTRAGEGGYGYLKEPLWWLGLILMGTGEAANFTAYAFAPATLVTPLGALSVLVAAVMSSYLLKERLNLLGKIGCLQCILGSTIVVIHSPKEQEVDSMESLAHKLVDPVFITYVAIVFVIAGVLIFYYAPRHGTTNVLIYIVICSVIGSLSVMGCKALGVALTETFSGRKNEFTNWLTYFFIFTVALFVSVQLNYLNKALDIFNTAVVTPIYYVFFTSFTIIASAILYKEWGHLGAMDAMGVICGFLTIVAGIFLLHAFKDMRVSLANLPKARKDQTPTNGDASDSGGFINRHEGDVSRNLLNSRDELGSEDEMNSTEHLHTTDHPSYKTSNYVSMDHNNPTNA
ncbi:magnesium transporter NIPA2 isoform X2 [Lingula anatina]|uniref:Magnesium transporter NIPA2 isoform X2 n=1 Tax=Lingula anatina TaxID=7574 RepID=A0A1S3GYY2_LINAN|nr:magnesium transporter NIPA2 isoform X2 [Lingula anatina]|eukprot:XP_013378882.1 magnesium transporter NIPA2 isoform X2 [Lingula anatina]